MFKTIFSSLIFLILSVGAAQASVLAVIDSGTDYLHQDLNASMWNNPNEIIGNQRDEDLNGYVDDFYGWNFAENNSEVIDYAYLGTLDNDIRKFFAIQLKSMQGTITQAERDWAKKMVADQEFIKKIQIYGNFMHGTHVSGIAVKGNLDARLMAIKLIPTEVKLPFSVITSLKNLTSDSTKSEVEKDGARMWLLKKGLGLLATQQMTLLTQIARYLDSMKVDVANGSFGTGYAQAQMIIGAVAKTALGREPTAEELKMLGIYFVNAAVDAGKLMVQEAPNTLFVFAAGNDGTNNDELPTSPANVKADNTISVAASMDDAELAIFSNYGVGMVDVAAPGVGIRSAVPGNDYIEVSGTSQAAPLVANVATQIKDANPGLSPKEIKAIIMQTVDKKGFLSLKIKSGGIVNNGRAVKAGVLSNSMDLKDAIAQANQLIVDEPLVSSPKQEGLSQSDARFVLPLPSLFK